MLCRKKKNRKHFPTQNAWTCIYFIVIFHLLLLSLKMTTFHSEFHSGCLMSDLAQEGFQGNKLLMHKNVHYRVSQPTGILLILSFRVLSYIQKWVLWAVLFYGWQSGSAPAFRWAGACTGLLTGVKPQHLALKTRYNTLKKSKQLWSNPLWTTLNLVLLCANNHSGKYF